MTPPLCDGAPQREAACLIFRILDVALHSIFKWPSSCPASLHLLTTLSVLHAIMCQLTSYPHFSPTSFLCKRRAVFCAADFKQFTSLISIPFPSVLPLISIQSSSCLPPESLLTEHSNPLVRCSLNLTQFTYLLLLKTYLLKSIITTYYHGRMLAKLAVESLQVFRPSISQKEEKKHSRSFN